jgi:signal recognition particle subunit SEC65
MAVIAKKDEKIKEVVEKLNSDYTEQDFIDKFKEVHPKDWEKISKNYVTHLRKNNHFNPDKKSKSFPMPKPEQYLINSLKVWLKK